MTLEEFKKIAYSDIKDMPEHEVVAYYDVCVKLFNLNFTKWLRGKSLNKN